MTEIDYGLNNVDAVERHRLFQRRYKTVSSFYHGNIPPEVYNNLLEQYQLRDISFSDELAIQNNTAQREFEAFCQSLHNRFM